MKILPLITHIITIIKKPISPTKVPKPPSRSTLSKLCQTKQFHSQISAYVTQTFANIQQNKIQITNWLLIKLIIFAFPMYSIVVVMFGIFAMVNLIGQPFINDQIKRIIGNKFEDNPRIATIQVIGIFLAAKIISGLLNILSDYYDMIYGVKIYNTIALALIKSINNKNKQIDSKFITCIQDDCQRLHFLPYSFINGFSKIIQGVIFSSLLISKLPSNTITLSILYWTFFIFQLLLALYSSKLNLKIMRAKQKRMEFGIKNNRQILQQRQKQLKQIKKLMIVDGVSIILPWFINVGLMATVYGVIGLDNKQKYFVLLVLGLLRISVTGLGSNMSIFGQAWSSLSRISLYLNIKYNKTTNNMSIQLQQQQQNQSHIISVSFEPSSSSNPSILTKLTGKHKHKHKQQKYFPITQLLTKINQLKSNFLPITIILSLLIFTANFMYSYCAKKLLIGQSIFQIFNIITLILQLLAPALLYYFVCFCNLKVSRDIYSKLLNSQTITNNNTNTNKTQASIQAYQYQYQQHKNQQIPQNFTIQQINRLSGDIRLLDRQFYGYSYGFISRIMGIIASFLYSVVALNNIILIIIVLLLIVIVLWLGWICRKIMTIRKQAYRKMSISKGKLLNTFYEQQSSLSVSEPFQQSYIKPWKNIYNYKCLGYIIQIVYITILQLLLIILATLVVTIVMISQINVQTSLVIVMMISQLDSQFIMLFLQVINLQTVTAAACRCFNIVKGRQRK